MNNAPLRNGIQTRRLLTAAVLAVSLAQASATTLDFFGDNPGPIPDATTSVAGLRALNFDVAGVTGPLTDLRLSMDLTHTYAGDVWARLLPPGTAAGFTLFTRVGYTNGVNDFGYESKLGGTYVFHNGAATTFWAAAGTAGTGVVPGGDYRTTDYGSPTPTDFFNHFASLPPESLNGVWELKIWDTQTGDVGSITSAKLTLAFSPIPEPGTATLLILGAVLLAGRRRA